MHKTIATLPWDGIWPEIMKAATTVLDALAQKTWHTFSYIQADIGWSAYAQHNNHLPQQTIDICKKADAILFGAVGGPVEQQHLPQRHNAEKIAILWLRKALWLAINVRPVQLQSFLAHLCPLKASIVGTWIDFIIIRELLGGIYFGKHTDAGDQAHDTMTYTTQQIEIPVRYAAKLAQSRSKKVTVVDKANVLESSRLWRRVVESLKSDYPDIEREYMYVDNAAMQLIKHPSQFDVMVTWNMFGDILSDAASVLPWSLWLMPSSSVGEQYALYEPIHGSAPDIANKNKANPLAMIMSAEMMLRHSFALHEEADILHSAIIDTLKAWWRTVDIASNAKNETSIWTQEITKQIVEKIQQS